MSNFTISDNYDSYSFTACCPSIDYSTSTSGNDVNNHNSTPMM